MNDHEQRRTPRISVDLPARFRSGRVLVDGRAGNLSQNGMLFFAPAFVVEQGQEQEREGEDRSVQVEIDLPDAEQPLTITGEVRWIHEREPGHPGMGIRFTQVSLTELRRLANYVILRAYHRPESQF